MWSIFIINFEGKNYEHLCSNTRVNLLRQKRAHFYSKCAKKSGAGWVDGWMDGWMGGRASLRIAYSNIKRDPVRRYIKNLSCLKQMK